MPDRNTGSFYTPKPFADFAHSVISKHFGDDWKSRYIVWDSAWGKGNLTRGYTFGNLFASTIDGSDLLSDANPEAHKFQFDFLNDEISKNSEIEERLRNNSPIIFFFNPPYAAHSEMINGVNLKNDFSSDTMISRSMGKLGKSKQNLFAQFLYRVKMIKNQYRLADCNICVFCPPIFMSGSGYAKFRKEFLQDFEFIDGYLFNASYFDECSDRWGISFSMWKSGYSVGQRNFFHHIIGVKDGKVEVVGKKDIYNIDGDQSLREWTKLPIVSQKTYPGVTLKSAINVGDREGSWKTEDAIGFYVNDGNSVYQSMKNCYIQSACPNSRISGFSVTPRNFDRVCVAFTARNVIPNMWMNNKDEFIAPDDYKYELKDMWEEFKADSVIYSLFNTSSNQSSLRNVEWMGGRYDINNEFFPFMSTSILAMANVCGYDEMLETYNGEERFTAKYIEENNLIDKISNEANLVWNDFVYFVIEGIEYRIEFGKRYPEYQIWNWDCGYYQQKRMFEEMNPERFKKFRKRYRDLGMKLKGQVYGLGLLK